MWRFDEARPFERFRLRESGERFEWSIRGVDDLNAITAEICERPGDAYYLPHALHFSGRSVDHITQTNAMVIDVDSGELEAALDGLRRRDLVPHYTIETRSGRFQFVLLMNPVRLSKHSRPAFLARFGKVQKALAALAGGDLRAAKPGQLYRVPGTLRRLGSELVEVRILSRSEHAAYTLGQLETAAGVEPSTFRGYTAADHGKPGRSALGSPALRWIQAHSIATGHRNAAAVALSYAAHLDGRTEDEALDLVLTMLQNAEAFPVYAESDAAATVRACYRNPKGLAAAILETITDTNGEVMGAEVARSVNRSMPRVSQRHRRKPASGLRNQPWCEAFSRIIEVLAAQQRANKGRPVVIRASDLCAEARVSSSTFEHRLVPLLRRLGVYQRTRRGRRLGIYDLARIPRKALTPYRIANWSPLRYATSTVLGFWRRARWTAWRRFTRALALLRALLVACSCKYPPLCGLESVRAGEVPQPRGPPGVFGAIVAAVGPQTVDSDGRLGPALGGVSS